MNKNARMYMCICSIFIQVLNTGKQISLMFQIKKTNKQTNKHISQYIDLQHNTSL